MASSALRPFELPAPDPTRLQVGVPDPRLGNVVAAWSNVLVRRASVPKAPLAGMGVLGAMTGALAGIAAGSPLALAGGIVLGAALGAAVVAAVARLFADRRSAYVGAAGYQTSTLGLGGVEDAVALFADHALLVSHGGGRPSTRDASSTSVT